MVPFAGDYLKEGPIMAGVSVFISEGSTLTLELIYFI